jgi:FtsP/CotA-like multicopper oxidase with cupredoxin domain
LFVAMTLTNSAIVLLTGIAVAAGCAPGQPDPGSGRPSQPSGWDDGVRLPEARDRNPAAGVVEIDLQARVAALEVVPGRSSPAWTYDGGVPGPLIRARAGDRLLVHFTNLLPEETTIHWHGVRLPAEMDGVPDQPHPAVPQGGTFDYTFTVPDAGLFWYHPHVRAAAQVGDGLYGALLVEPSAAAADRPGAGAGVDMGDDLVLVLSDMQVNDDGTLGDPEAGGDIGALFGREGNTVLVNGRVAPTVRARPGLRQRWRIVNAAKSRYFQLAVADHRFTRIGGDGGLIAAPLETDRLLVIPGERADVVVTFHGSPGTRLPVRWIAYDRGFGSTEFRPEENILYVELSPDEPVDEVPLPATLREVAPLDVAAVTTVRSIALTQATVDGRLVLGIDGVPSWEADPLHAHAGDTELWTVTNAMDWDHPFHFHGFFFQPLDPTSLAPAGAPEWKDTLNVPRRQQIVFAIRYDDRPGMWMFHCHILDHADAGMMGMLHLF